MKHPIHTLHVNKTDALTTFEFILKTMTKDLKHEKQSGELKAKLSNFIKVCYEETLYSKDIWDNKRSHKIQRVINRSNNNKGRSTPKVFKIYVRQEHFY